MLNLDIIFSLPPFHSAGENDILAAIFRPRRQRDLKADPVEHFRDNALDVPPFEVCECPSVARYQ